MSNRVISDNRLNGWNIDNEMLYNRLTLDEKIRLDAAMLNEIERAVPFNRKSFKEVYFLTLNRRPKELFTERKICEMHVELLQKEINEFKRVFRVK